MLLLAALASAPGAALADAAAVRTDGLYWTGFVAGGGKHRFGFYLRFYGDGEVISSSELDPPDKVAKQFDRTGTYAKGNYSSEAGRLRFTTTSKDNTVDYSGTVEGRSLKLEVSGRVHMFRDSRTYTFLSFEDIRSGKYDRDLGKRSAPRVARAVGPVESVADGRITIRPFGGPQRHTYTFDEGTPIFAAGRRITAEELSRMEFSPADRVMVYGPQGGGVATRIEVLGVALTREAGTLSRLTDTEAVVNSRSIPVDPRTRYVDEKGNRISAAGIETGRAVTVTRSGRDGPAVEVRQGFHLGVGR